MNGVFVHGSQSHQRRIGTKEWQGVMRKRVKTGVIMGPTSFSKEIGLGWYLNM
jgi:hypothetical protein